MDVSPQLLREVKVGEQWLGYNPDEVDDFLERLAVALGQLQDQLREVSDRAGRAERRVLEGSGAEDELSRTLVLAQRTADAALDEARQEAAALLAEAEARAAEVTRSADERAAATQQVAEELASGVVGDAEARVANELAPLLAQRDALEHDVEALRVWAAEIRSRMADELRQQLAWLDGEEAALPDAPTVIDLELPEPGSHAAVGDEVASASPSDEAPVDLDGPGADAVHREEGRSDRGGDAGDADQGDPTDPDATGLFDALADADPQGEAREYDARDRFAATSWEDHGDHGVEGGALATAAAQDPFMAELRRAVTDDEPLGPRDHREAGGVDADGEGDDDRSSSVFRRRKRR